MWTGGSCRRWTGRRSRALKWLLCDAMLEEKWLRTGWRRVPVEWCAETGVPTDYMVEYDKRLV